MKIQQDNQSSRQFDESKEQVEGKSFAPAPFSLSASPSDVADDSNTETDAEGNGLIAGENTSNQAADGNESEGGPKERLDKLLGRKTFQHANEIPILLGQLAAGERELIKASSAYRNSICSAVRKKKHLIGDVLIVLECELTDKIEWLVAWQRSSNPGMVGDYALVRGFVQGASQSERDALNTTQFLNLFRSMESDERGAIGMIDDLNFDLSGKFVWYRSLSRGVGRYKHIKHWLSSDPGSAENALSDLDLRSWFVSICVSEELLQACDLMQLSLATTIEFLREKEKTNKFKLSLAQIQSLLSRDAVQVAELLGNQPALSYILSKISIPELTELLMTSIHGLGISIRLLAAKYQLGGRKITYAQLQGFILIAPEAERATLNGGDTREIILNACNETTIFTALEDLKFDLATKLDWLKSMRLNLSQIYEGPTLDYAAISPLVTGAKGEDKAYLQSEAGQDQVMKLGAGKSIGTAISDLDMKLPLREKIQRVYPNGGIASIKILLESESQKERDKIWKDTKTMLEFRKLMGDNAYLTLVCALRMRFGGVANLEKATEVDAMIQKQLGAYVNGAVEKGRHFDGEVAVVDTYHWDIAGELDNGAENWKNEGKNGWAGFVDKSKRAFVYKEKARKGTMTHEAIHKYSALGADGIIYASQPLNEGITEYFTRKVCKAGGIEFPKGRSYDPNYSCVVKLVSFLGEKVVANAFFDGPATVLEVAFKARIGKSSGTDIWSRFIEHTKKDEWRAASNLIS